MKKIFKCKNLFLVTFLAVAGIFSTAAINVNKHMNDNSVIEKADARDASTDYIYLRWTSTPKNYYDSNYSCDFDAGEYYPKAHFCNAGSTIQTDWPGIKPDKVADNLWKVAITNASYTYVIFNCVKDPGDQYSFKHDGRDYVRSTYNGASSMISIPSDLSKKNCFNLSKYNCPNGSDCGTWEYFDPSLYVIGAGSFSGSPSWSTLTGVKTSFDKTYEAKLSKQFFDENDVFQISDGNSFYGGYNKLTSNDHFGSTMLDTLDGTGKMEIEIRLVQQDGTNWWGNSTRIKTEFDSNPSMNQTIDLGAATGIVKVYPGFTRIKACRHVGNTDYNTVEVVGAITDTTKSYYYTITTWNNSGGSGCNLSRSDKTSGINPNIYCKKSGYYDITLNNTRTTITITNHDEFLEGDSVYLDLNGYNWEASSAAICAHFYVFGSAVNENVQMTKVHNHGGNTVIYECKIPAKLSSGVPNRIKFYRAESRTAAVWWNYVNELAYNAGKNVFKLSSYGSENTPATGAWSDHFSKYERASFYASYFLELTSGVCVQDGSTNVTNLNNNAWSPLKTEYDNMANLCQGVVYESNTSTSGTTLQRAMARYDYIVFHKRYSMATTLDYIGRSDSSGKGPYNSVYGFSPYSLISDGESNTTTILITVASSISILSITALSVLMVKKRKNKEQ